MSQKFFYPAIFEPEDVGYSVYIPDIPGCVTQGDSMEEALAMVQEAIGLMLEDKKVSESPKASAPQDVALEGKQFVMMVEFDKLAYDKKIQCQSRKKDFIHPRLA